MKKILFYLIFIYFVSVLLMPVVSFAATCESLGGECKDSCSAMEEEKSAGDCDAMTPKCCVIVSTGTSTDSSGGSSKAVKTVSLDNPLTVEAKPAQIIGLIIKSFLGIIGGLALVMMVWGGFLWLTSAGNQDRVKNGTSTMIWAIVGLILTLGSYLIMNTLMNFLTGRIVG